MIVINILFQNQNVLLGNSNDDYVQKDPNNLPKMCIHKKESDDFQAIARQYINQSFMERYHLIG